MKRLRFISALSFTVLLWFAPAALAQSQQKPKQEDSLAEAARRARAQRKPAASTEKVWTNDNLRTGEIRLLSSAGEADLLAAAEGAQATATAATTPEDERERIEAEDRLNDEKARFAQLKSDLTLLERDFDLARQQFYSNPAYANDTVGQQRLDLQQQQIAARQTEISASELKVKELEERLAQINQRLGPRPQQALSSAEQQAQWNARLQPLRAELARVEVEIERMRAEVPNSPAPSAGTGNDFTRNQIATLEARRAELQRKIAAVQDEARRAGTPPGWVRP